MTQGFFFKSEGVTQAKFNELVTKLRSLGVNIDAYNKDVDVCVHWVLYHTRGYNYFYGINISESDLLNSYKYQMVSLDVMEKNVFNILNQIEDSYNRSNFEYYSPYTLDDTYIIRTVTGIDRLLNNKQNLNNKEVSMEIVKQKEKFKFSDEVIRFLKDMKVCASEGNYSKVIGRDKEVDLVIKTLARHKKANPMLVGESGVGKTAVVEELAQRLVSKCKSIPDYLKDMDLYEIDIGELVAGAKYQGDLQERVTSIFNEVNKHGNCIVFMDEVHQIKNKTSENSTDIGNLLKKHLTNPNIRVIGSTTYSEFKNSIEKDPALPRRFNKIEILEPSLTDTLEILKGLKSTYEQIHNVKYSDKLIKEIVTKTDKFITKGCFPDKAIDILDLAGTHVKLENRKQVKVDDVDTVISAVSRIPVDQIGKSSEDITNLESNLKSCVFGQDHAIESVVRKIKVNKAGLIDDNKPIASIMFCGSSGSGKTELSKSLAEFLGAKLLRLDMSEYTSDASYTKLVGSNAGYVNSEQGGLLTQFVDNNPNSVIIVDECEKSNYKVLEIFLQIMDNGFLTDGLGRVIDFRNTIILFTSNVGVRASESVKQGIGFMSDTVVERKQETLDEVLKATFAPEFRGRLNDIVYFNPLSKGIMKDIVNKFVKEVTNKVKFDISVRDDVIEYLAEEGYCESMGARPVKGLVYDKIVTPLADIVLGGSVTNKSNVEVVMEGKDVKVVVKGKVVEE